MELWIDAVQNNSNQFQPSITTGGLDWKETKVFTSPTSFSSWNNMETSRICQELLRRQPSASTSSTMELEPEQPVFVKEVQGNVWKTGTIDQPASEPDSYWVRFPDNSILRRTRSMIKSRSLPSHFELKAEQQPWNS